MSVTEKDAAIRLAERNVDVNHFDAVYDRSAL